MQPSDNDGTTSAGDDVERLCACKDGDSDVHGDEIQYGTPHCLRCRKSQSSSTSYHSYAICETNSDRINRIISASAKGFSIGLGLKGGISLFSLLARLARRRSSLSSEGAVVLTSLQEILTVIKETFRYGIFLGTFAATFTSVDEIIAAFGGHCRTAKWRALLAGAVAGPSMLLTGLNTQNNSLAIYILMRAAVLASRCGVKSKRFGHICKPLTWSYGDIFLMCLSSSQILCAYILKQDSLPSSYKSFLNKHGGKDLAILQGVKDIANGNPISNLKAIEKYYSSIGVNMSLDPRMKIPCTIIHGHQSCGEHFISFLVHAYRRALPVYVPVYLVPTLIAYRQHLLKRPWIIMGQSGYGIARSSLFLSIYSASAWIWTCIVFRISRRYNIPLLAMGTFATGLAIGIEKNNRRTKISLYCLGRAIETFFACMADVGYLPQSLMSTTRVDVIVFSLSMSIIMHCYSQEREVFRTKYLNVLDWVFGVPPTHCYTLHYKQNSEDEYI